MRLLYPGLLYQDINLFSYY